ncbi:hypothetical protein LCGC14_0622580 [marine sediment metagenome]|uniref:Uncharacterized protein n=1 Tax=marine sediment metagenome TaxID=412755 RepID=A0A0F9RNP5_9ZZZZ
MRIISIFITVFLLAAFAIGISMADNDMSDINLALDNASIIATNFSLANTTNNTYANGVLLVAEKFVHFITVSMVEIMRVGILFGHDNPDYFTPDFIIGITKLLIWVMIVSMLIVPIMYFLGFLIMIAIWVISKFKGRKNGKKTD